MKVDLLDQIVLNDDSRLTGVVDFVNKKHIYFINFTEVEDQNLIISAISWCVERPNKRFSIYIKQNFRGLIQLPETKLVHFNSIKETNFDLEHFNQSNSI